MSTGTTIHIEMNKNGRWNQKELYYKKGDGTIDKVNLSCGSNMRELLKYISNNFELESTYCSVSDKVMPIDISLGVKADYLNDKEKYNVFGFNYFYLKDLEYCKNIIQSTKNLLDKNIEINYITQLLHKINKDNKEEYISNITVDKNTLLEDIENGYLINKEDGFEESLNTLLSYVYLLCDTFLLDYNDSNDVRIYFWFDN